MSFDYIEIYFNIPLGSAMYAIMQSIKQIYAIFQGHTITLEMIQFFISLNSQRN